MNQTEEQPNQISIELNPEEMAKAGLHLGHRTFRVHPKMKPYLYGSRNAVHVIDLEKTTEKLKEALQFVHQLIIEQKTLLLVGTKIQMKGELKKAAEALSLPYIVGRWPGGMFTNYETIRKRIDYLKSLEQKKTAGDLEKYTKKERARIEREIRDLQEKFGGIRELQRLPEAVFVLDLQKDRLAVDEARMKGIKILAITDTNVDPSLVDYPIPANDDTISSVTYILAKLQEVIENAKSKIQPKKQ